MAKKDEERISQDIRPSSGTGSGSKSSGGYVPRDSSGNDYASMVGMNDLDRAALDAAGASWQAANKAGDTAGMEAAHKQAEAIRSQYGYSGGGDGSQYIPFSQDIGGGRGGGFSYESAPTYTNRYQSQIDELTAAILGREAFSYDPEKDPTYQQYKESYTRDGKRAMQDTLGQVSARTGGLASSYAGSAAQQTYDNYMGALADKIPELRQLAYSMYMDEGNTQRANLEMLMALEAGDYAKYADLLGQYNTDRNFNYGVFSDDRNFNYQLGRDEIEDSRYEDETAYNREQDEWEKLNYSSEKEYNKALDKAQTLAAAGDFSGYAALGYSTQEIANLKTAYDRAQAASRPSSGKGSSDGSSDSEDIYNGMYKSGIRSEGDAYAWLLAAGYNTTQAGKLAGYFAEWMEGQGDGSGSGSDYSLQDLNTSTVLQLGIGPISYGTVEQLIEQGKVDVYTDSNGKLSVRWANGYNASNYKGDSGALTPGDMIGSLQDQLDKILGR